ncbi:hypothetical protein VH570_01470 [Sphingobium sp. HT1-2]|uniref:hypothetical protein n=1 Tax=Sphingobium sp. HT1-2 TaxID=3111640 RepID=UPI003BFAB017
MTSTPDEAGLRALLDFARANEVRKSHDEMLKASLPEAAFVRYRALTRLSAGKEFNPRFHERKRNAPPPPDELFQYGVELGKAMKSVDKAVPKKRRYEEKLQKALRYQIFLERSIKEQEEIIANAAATKQRLWDQFNALPDDCRDWIADGTAERGWPPKRYDTAPPHILFPGEQLPWSKALEIVVQELLDEL